MQFKERCEIVSQCLSESAFRHEVVLLHADMLAEIERLNKWKHLGDHQVINLQKAFQDMQAQWDSLRGIIQNDILSAMDDCVELGMTAGEMRNVIKAIIAKTL